MKKINEKSWVWWSVLAVVALTLFGPSTVAYAGTDHGSSILTEINDILRATCAAIHLT
ncbi:MAG: hypothetical protein IT366_00445 [Candidatus Hydrogenedentes bacterium]|nr:hypothetical protein [Candidatus Hydrogenedentota bacterium]